MVLFAILHVAAEETVHHRRLVRTLQCLIHVMFAMISLPVKFDATWPLDSTFKANIIELSELGFGANTTVDMETEPSEI